MSHVADMGSYIPARDAALEVRLHPDYIARLARQERIQGKRVGRRWYVDPVSLQQFLSEQSAEKEERRERLKKARRREYGSGAGETAITAIEETIAENVPHRTHRAVATGVRHAGVLSTPGINMHAVSYAIHPGTDFLHRLVALISAIIIVFGGYSLLDREFGAAVAQGISNTAIVAGSFALVLAGSTPECASYTQRMAAAAHTGLQNALISLENMMPSGLAEKPLVSSADCTP